ncbi:MAG: TonB-dependent receptor [Rhodospirillaceae bacterium]|nr:TonB-dependent receptor [Rhodospirillaceae bacterium]
MNLNWLQTGVALVLALGAGPAQAQDAISEITVTGRRLPPSVNEPIFASTRLAADELGRIPGARLDEALRAVPGFGLFRRQSSRASHPTTQGVTLRGLGPSGAGRTLVLLDGVPQNDPFGGWVDWSRLPTANIGAATLTRGGGAGPWGNAALAGVVRLSRAPSQAGTMRSDVTAGSNDSVDASAHAAARMERAVVSVNAHGHRTDGSFLIRKDQRGVVDRRAADRGGVGSLSADIALDDATSLRLVGNYSESRLVNGIDIAVSKTKIADGAVSLVHEDDDKAWEANLYARDQDFRAVFAAVNAARTTATPSLDQFSVPATAYGGNLVLRQTLTEELSIDAGADARFVDGTTNERFQNLGAGFTRLRAAGGEQTLVGGFADLNWQASPRLLATVGARLDYWRQADGQRVESVIQTGAVVRNDAFAARDGVAGNFRAGLRYDADEALTLRLAAYSGFRLPTLNELYRPFRVGNDITEANPALTLERLVGGDIGVDWTPSPDVVVAVTYFRSRLKDGVANVTLRTTPGLDPATGVVVPVGGVLRQRRNLDRIAASGIEVDATVALSPELKFSARYLFTSPKVTRSPDQRALEGLRLAQVARHQASVGLAWTPLEPLSLNAQVRAASKQFDDDLNARALRGYAVVDVSGEWRLTEAVGVVAGLENAFDRTVEAGRSADGLITVASPRTFTIGLRAGF